MTTQETTMEIYCLKCKTKTQSNGVREEAMKNGRPAYRGTCSVCGAKTNKIKSSKVA